MTIKQGNKHPKGQMVPFSRGYIPSDDLVLSSPETCGERCTQSGTQRASEHIVIDLETEQLHEVWGDRNCSSPVHDLGTSRPGRNGFGASGRKFSSKQKRPGEQGAAGYCPQILLLKRAKMVLCPFYRSHREICTRNRTVSETKFLDDFWGPLSLPAPLFYC